MKKVLFVVTSHDQLGNTGEKTGFWTEEFAAPYYELLDKGIAIEIATPLGGQPPIDPKSEDPSAATEDTKRFDKDTELLSKLKNTLKLADVNQADYDAVFYPGGHGPLWDLIFGKRKKTNRIFKYGGRSSWIDQSSAFFIGRCVARKRSNLF